MPAILSSHRGLVAFQAPGRVAVTKGRDGQPQLPARLVIGPAGVHETGQGRIIFNATTARELPGNQRRTNFDRVVIDFNHNTVPESPAYRGEPTPVAGYGDPVVAASGEIALENITWTPEGEQFVGGRHYIDLSPTVQLNARGEAVFLHSAAVCRNGAIPRLSLFHANPLNLPQINSNPMDYKQLLCTLLKLDPNTSSDELIEETSTAFAEKMDPGSEDQDDDGEETPGTATDQAETVKTLSAEVRKLATQLRTLTAAAVTTERQQIITAALAQGKEIPGDVLEGAARLSNEQLRIFAASLPATVPVGRRTALVTGEAKRSGVLVANSAEEQVRKQMGISEDAWKKHTAA
ncbi:MAG: phage protease [Chthoniobacteraceae bacterium]